MIKIVKINKNFGFLKNSKNLKTENGNILFVKRKKHAELIIREYLDKVKSKDPNSLINLTFFSCNLRKDEIDQLFNQCTFAFNCSQQKS